MSQIVAARFQTFDAAEHAAHELSRRGIGERDQSIFFVSPRGQHAAYPGGGDYAADPGSRKAHVGALSGASLSGLAGAVVGGALLLLLDAPIVAIIIAAAVGAYVGSLFGAFLRMRNAGERRVAGRSTGVRHGGVLLAVHVTPDSEAMAASVLRDEGGMDVEQAQGRWQDGTWVDFDPVKPPVLSDKVRPDRAGAVG